MKKFGKLDLKHYFRRIFDDGEELKNRVTDDFL